MDIIDADLVKEDQGIRLDVTAYSATLNWTGVSLSAAKHFTPPVDGIQDVFLNGNPPEGNAFRSIMVYPLSILIPEFEWLQGVRIQNGNGDLLLTIRTPVKESEPVGEDWLVVTGAGLKGDKLIVDVEYGGGCRQHIFQLNWDGKVLKSNPPQIMLDLSHNAHGDPCRALMFDKLQFDLSVIIDSAKSYAIRIKSSNTEVVADIGELPHGNSGFA